MVYSELARTVGQFPKPFLEVASTCCSCKVLVQAVFPDSCEVPPAIISVVFVKVVDAIPLLRSVEDRAAVHRCVVVPDVEEGAARVEFILVVEGEDARQFKLIIPGHIATWAAKLMQALSWRRYVS